MLNILQSNQKLVRKTITYLDLLLATGVFFAA